MNLIKQIWQCIRQLSGDDVYERYLAHYTEHHADEVDSAPPLSRAEFFRQWQDRKWQGIKRCC
ncbi:MAG TPA: YbdD/YjiX family protein [Methylophilus sp.]|uniref:YbdD/YjiX family protein n=1 Tax=Methylophilus sp. TaxID=29541 RepID=UPI002CEF0B9E|nr:YbdD/YjiX family protein [Methylophilus sp.]HSH87961.1 YbdD/YjiX family protein [Methylophilus sp.]